MAHTNNNVVTGLRGMVGKLVFRTVRGKTIVSSRPQPPRHQSQRQREHRQRFREASRLARLALLDPQKKQLYTYKARKLNLPNAYTAALTDYLRRPTVDAVQYKEQRGTLSITATKKDFAIAAIEVAITDAQGAVLVTTSASRTENVKQQWMAKLPVNPWKNDAATNFHQLVVTARDHTGNSSQKVIALHPSSSPFGIAA